MQKKNGGDLGYLDRDIFPEEFEQFEKAIENLNIGDFSEIIELEDTLHIISVTEISKPEPLTEDQIKVELTEELIETESLALMNDDFNFIEDLILDGSSIEEIAESINKVVSFSELYTKSNYDFYISDFMISDYLFSQDSETNKPYAIELDDKVVVVSISLISEPELQSFEQVAEDVSDFLSESKAIEKLALMEREYMSLDALEDQEKFIKAYNFITQDSYVDLKRYSALLPQEVLSEIFNNQANTILSINANNGDKFIVQIDNFNQMDEDEINSIIDEYSDFSKERLSSKMSEIINEDVFESARVNLNNLVF